MSEEENTVSEKLRLKFQEVSAQLQDRMKNDTVDSYYFQLARNLEFEAKTFGYDTNFSFDMRGKIVNALSKFAEHEDKPGKKQELSHEQSPELRSEGGGAGPEEHSELDLRGVAAMDFSSQWQPETPQVADDAVQQNQEELKHQFSLTATPKFTPGAEQKQKETCKFTMTMTPKSVRW